jgi:uncharacterized membrane protein YdjX (TVP38/TMEM64 family)
MGWMILVGGVALVGVLAMLAAFLGGLVFGEWLGLGYSMLGLTVGSLLAFGVGRWLGAAFVQRLVSPAAWVRLGFVVEAEGTIPVLSPLPDPRTP